MNDRKRILVLNTSDAGGGAESVARVVSGALRSEGHEVMWAVGRKRSDLPWVVDLQSDRPASWLGFGPSLTRFLSSQVGKVKGAGALLRALDGLARTRNALRWRSGRDPYDFPELERVFRRFKPDIVYCHNLHGSGLGNRAHQGYFDLRLLASWSQSAPIYITLHDAWMLTGHCAYPIDCPRFETGCGECPHLDYPPIYRGDATAENWRAKRDVYTASDLHVSAPSNWLLQMVKKSILRPAANDLRCIPNGVDLNAFSPTDRSAARASLGLPTDGKALLFLSGGLRSPYKGFPTTIDVYRRLQARQRSERLVLLVGGVRPGETLPDDPGIVGIPRSSDPGALRAMYAAADVYLHPAAADNHPLAVLEALACGRPVAAFAVGGIPEQVTAGQTGVLASPGNAGELADAIDGLLGSEDDTARLGRNARADAEARFDVRAMQNAYIEWMTGGQL